MAGRTTLKIVVVGDSFVGKTSLISQFVNRKFTSEYKATIGVDLATRTLAVGDAIVSLQVWDPSGTERFSAVTANFYRGTDACMLVCAVTAAGSFAGLGRWLRDVDAHAPGVPVVVAANKADVDSVEWEVTEAQLRGFCAERGLAHFLVSAKDASNVEAAFNALAEQALARSLEIEASGHAGLTAQGASAGRCGRRRRAGVLLSSQFTGWSCTRQSALRWRRSPRRGTRRRRGGRWPGGQSG